MQHDTDGKQLSDSQSNNLAHPHGLRSKPTSDTLLKSYCQINQTAVFIIWVNLWTLLNTFPRNLHHWYYYLKHSRSIKRQHCSSQCNVSKQSKSYLVQKFMSFTEQSHETLGFTSRQRPRDWVLFLYQVCWQVQSEDWVKQTLTTKKKYIH